MYQVVAFYKYVRIEDAPAFAQKHLEYCKNLGIGCRTLIAYEGINGQLSGTAEQCSTYMDDLRKDVRFSDVDFKIDACDKPAFYKTHVRFKREIVNSGLFTAATIPTQSETPSSEPGNSLFQTSRHLKPKEFKELKEKKNVIILDVRSEYETRIGRFKNALTLDLEHFRDFPQKIGELREQLADKTILTYCTGGIKCEKASAYLLQLGFKDVYQLEGGIIKYAKEAGGEDFEGKCYVFDGRVVADVNQVNPSLISSCIHCGKPSARIVNCVNELCNEQIIICEDCGWEWDGACSHKCRSEAKRPYNGTGYYVKI